jgi:hypothetical protein
MNQKARISASITTLLMLLHFFAVGQMTVYNNFGEGHDGWDYNYGLGWTISGDSVESQYGVQQAMEFQSTEDGVVTDIWVAISRVPMSSPADTVIIRLCENPTGMPPDTADIMEEWTLTSFASWSQWNTPHHLVGNGTSILEEGHSYWLWAIGNDETWTMWCMNEDPAFTCPHAMRREGENWLSVSNETASAFRVDLALNIGIENNYGSLDDFTLSQNYPNPFNSSTNISYTVKAADNISLCIYDMYGREIQTLVNEYSAPGNYTVAYNTSHLSNGIYFCRLQHRNQIEIIKMSCLK